MEIVQFDISGKFAHFRKYYANNTALTYSLPPRTTVMGMLAAIMGAPKDSYYEELASDRIRIGIAIRTPIKKTFHRLNFLSIKSLGDIRKSFDSDFRGMAGNPIQTPFEVVTGNDVKKDEIVYRIFLGSTESGKATFAALKKRLLERDWVYAPTFGIANFHASPGNVMCHPENNVVENQGSSARLSFDSAVNADNVLSLIFEKEPDAFVEEELLPADFLANGNREVARMVRALFTSGGIPLKVEITGTYHTIQAQSSLQTIQFL